MLQYLKETQEQTTNYTYTENGAYTLKSANSACLDLFGTIGALRNAEETDIINRFARAYKEDASMAMKILFFARDVRGGLGERRVFRIILHWLAQTHPQSVLNNMPWIAEFGRYDDLLCLWDTLCQHEMIAFMKAQLEKDLDAMQQNRSVSLLAKWLPSVNATSKETVYAAKRLAKALGMQEALYRKTLSSLRSYLQITENYLREKDYSFAYQEQPSGAMMKYRAAFWRNDGERYQQYLDAVSSGEKMLHTGTLTPYEVIRPVLQGGGWFTPANLSLQDRKSLDITWNALADYTSGENALVVVDGSGSMYNHNCLAISVALSLGIYFAERNTGIFHNHFITFSTTPKLVEIKGRDIYEKVQHCAKYNEAANTDLQRVFDLILQTAIQHQLPQEQMPSSLYIISDMEFDACIAQGSVTNFEFAKKKYQDAGYHLPQVIFWNVDSRNTQQPVSAHDTGTALVSGCSSRLFAMLAKKQLNPYNYMTDILSSERYALISA